ERYAEVEHRLLDAAVTIDAARLLDGRRVERFAHLPLLFRAELLALARQRRAGAADELHHIVAGETALQQQGRAPQAQGVHHIAAAEQRTPLHLVHRPVPHFSCSSKLPFQSTGGGVALKWQQRARYSSATGSSPASVAKIAAAPSKS